MENIRSFCPFWIRRNLLKKLCVAQLCIIVAVWVVYLLDRKKQLAMSTLRGMEIIRNYELADTEQKWIETRNSIQNINLHRTRTLFSTKFGQDMAHIKSGSPNLKITDPYMIAIGCAITSRGVNTTASTWLQKVSHLPFFIQLLPSFCKTVSVGFNYHFYLAHDYDDPWLAEEQGRQAFQLLFHNQIDVMCKKFSRVDMSFVQSNDSGKPARAQNDALIRAYKDGVASFFYRVNDDTVLVTAGWTEVFIGILWNFEPPLLGVVGPSFNTNGGYANFQILTYEFVHRTHVDVFGFYYPPLLTAWYADDWVTKVYQPGRCVKVNDIIITHTQKLGRRYNIGNESMSVLLDDQINRDRKILAQWVVEHHGKKRIRHENKRRAMKDTSNQ